VLWRVSIPLAWRGLVAGAALGFARAVGEFGATVMVAGNVPGRTQTASLAVYDAVQAGRLADAATLSAVLAGMTGAVLLFVTRWGRR
jgi:molybdate transport system permease protein